MDRARRDPEPQKLPADAERRLVDRLNDLSLATRTGGWELDVKTEVRSWTDGCNAVLGRPLDAPPLSGPEYTKFVHPEDRDVHGQFLNGLLERGESFDFTYRLIVNEEVLTVRSIAKAARDDQGQIVRFVGTVQDITDNTVQCNKLDQAQRLLTSILAILPDRICVYDIPSHTDVWMNRPLTDLVGYEADDFEMFGNDLHGALIHKDDIAKRDQRDEVLHTLRDGQFHEMEYRLRHVSGDWVTILSRSTIFERDDQGNPTKMFGIQKDISQRKKLRDELERSEEMVRRTLEDAPLGIAIVDLDGKLQRVNRAYCAIMGKASEELVGESLAVGIDREEDLDSFVDWLVQAREVGPTEPHRSERRIVLPDGSERWADFVISVVLNDGHEPLHLVLQLSDCRVESRRSEVERAA